MADTPPFDLLAPLLQGLGTTVVVTVLASVGATAASIVGGLSRVSRVAPFRWLATVYVAVFRGTSALVQLFWAYFALPLLGVRIDAMTAAVVVLSLNTGAYGTELVRGAIGAVDIGQWRAARALGLDRSGTMRHVILPQTLPRLLPPYGNLLVELCKNSALVSLVTLADLTFQANTVLRVQQPGRTASIFAWTLLLYFAVAFVIRVAVRAAEHRATRWVGARGSA